MTNRQSFQAFTNTYHATWNYGCPTPPQIGCGLKMDGVTLSNDDWQAGPHLHNSPAFWREHLSDWSEEDHLKQFNFDVGTRTLKEKPIVGGIVATPTLMPGGLLSISANGTHSRNWYRMGGSAVGWCVHVG